MRNKSLSREAHREHYRKYITKEKNAVQPAAPRPRTKRNRTNENDEKKKKTKRLFSLYSIRQEKDSRERDAIRRRIHLRNAHRPRAASDVLVSISRRGFSGRRFDWDYSDSFWLADFAFSEASPLLYTIARRRRSSVYTERRVDARKWPGARGGGS